MNEENDAVAALIRAAGKRPSIHAATQARVRAAVEDEWRATIRRRRFTRVGGALVAIAAGASVVVWFLPQPKPTIPAMMPVVAYVESVRGDAGLFAGQSLRKGVDVQIPANATASIRWGRATLRLDGGTHLRIDGLTLATMQSGALYYSDPQRDLSHTIATPFGEVRDIGTRFELRLHDDALRVRVRDGIVTLRDQSAHGGQELIATRAAIEQHAIATTGEEWSWIERAAPPLLLEGKTLAQVLYAVAEEKGLSVEWSDASIGKVRLHGDVPLMASEALDAATTAAGVSYRIEGTRLIVGSRT
jgi:ferric-dicitrate binding protein FerR (iron transport regulator)